MSFSGGSITTDTNYGTIKQADTIATEEVAAPKKVAAVRTQNAAATPEAVAYTEAVVREYFADIPVMIEVARCESNFRHTLADGSVLRGVVDGRDTGVMQINTGYHLQAATAMGLDLTVLQDNLVYARSLYVRQGTQPWSASRSCWGGQIAYNG